MTIYALLVGGVTAFQLWPQLEVSFAPVNLRQEQIRVQVTGAVQNPGIYALAGNPTVAQAIQAAGGTLPQAELAQVDLERAVEEGNWIEVPAAPPAGPTTPERDLIDPNQASESQLETLPGIGPAKAKAIIEHRPYTKVEDLLNVPGIGEKTLDEIKNLVTIREQVQVASPEPISLNHASEAQLETLPGIGPAKAKAIIEHRPYTKVEDLLNVPGIGEKTLESLRPLVKP